MYKYDLVEGIRGDVKHTLEVNQRGRCLATGLVGTDMHEVIFKRSDRPGEKDRSSFWHPYNCVLLSNPYHLKYGSNPLHTLWMLAYQLQMYGQDELEAYVKWVGLRTGPHNLDQFIARRVNKIDKATSGYIMNNELYIEKDGDRDYAVWREWGTVQNEFI